MPLKGTIAPKTPVKKVINRKTLDKFGLLLTTQKSLDDFTQKSGKLATSGANEYQHHYSSIVYNVTAGNESLDISIPLVLYNYKQEVSAASIGFELTDVAEMVEATSPVSAALAVDFQEQPVHAKIMELFPDATINITHYQQVHKHPGKLSSFSGTDLDTKPGNPGICFPFSTCDEPTASFGSIVCHVGGFTELVHTEYRQVLGDLEEGDEIVYEHGRSITHVKGHQEPLGRIESLFAKTPRGKESYRVLNGVDEENINETIMEIIIAFEQSDYQPNTDFIFPDNVSEVKRAWGGGGMGYYNKKKEPTVAKNKYGKKATERSLLESIEDIDFQSDADDESVTKELMAELGIAVDKDKRMKYEDMVEGCTIPEVEENAMSAMETSETADILREELEMYGLETKALTVATDAQIFKWAAALELIELT